MAESKIEQVAKALARHIHAGGDYGVTGEKAFEDRRVDYIFMACAAIWAMREPTVAMYVAGDRAILSHLNSKKIIVGEDTPAVDSWRTMIDAALSEEVAG
jgi:hypothetical protein